MAHDWITIEADYINDTTQSTSSLSNKYGVPAGTIGARMAKFKWNDKRQEKSLKVKTESIQRATEDQITVASQFCSDDLEVSIKIRKKVAELMLTIDSPNDINALAAAADKAQKIGRLALGLSTSNSELTNKTDDLDELKATIEYLKASGIEVNIGKTIQ